MRRGGHKDAPYFNTTFEEHAEAGSEGTLQFVQRDVVALRHWDGGKEKGPTA